MNKHSQRAELQDTKEKDCRREVQISNDYIEYHTKCLAVLLKFEHLWDRHLAQVKIDKPQIEPFLPDKKLINSAPYWAGTTAQ